MADAPASKPRSGRHDLTKGPIGRTMLVFALPVLGTSVVQSLNQSINAIWIGQLIGERGLTATANAGQIMFLLLSAVFGVGLAATILVGQAYGRHDLAEARRTVGTMASFFAITSILLAAVGYAATDTMLRVMGTPLDAQPFAVAYLRVIFLALPFIYFNTFLAMALRGSGDSRTPFLFTILATLFDVGLNPLLIEGWGPFPRMGIAGSAAATLVSQTIGLVGLLTYVYARRFPIRIPLHEIALLIPDRRLLKASILKGIPMGLQMIVVVVSGISMLGIVNGYGVTTTAAYGVAGQLWVYIQMPALAVGAAASSFAAQNIGAKRWDRVERTAGAGILINVALTGGLILLVYLVERPLIALFLPHDPAAWPITMHINAVGLWAYLFLGAGFVLFAVVRATGAVWPPLIVLTFALIVVRIPATLALLPRLGVDAVWWTSPLSMIVALVLAAAYYRWGGWRRSRMVEAPEVAVADAGGAPPVEVGASSLASPEAVPARA